MRSSVLVQDSGGRVLNEVEALRGKLELSQEGLARLLDVSHRTLWRLENDTTGTRPNTPASQRFARLACVVDRIVPPARPDIVVRWLCTPLKEFVYCIPRDLIFLSNESLEAVVRMARKKLLNGSSATK